MSQTGVDMLSGESLAQQFRHNLLNIKLLAETQPASPEAAQILVQTSASLKFIEAFLLAKELQSRQVELEPVSISATLHDVAHTLAPIAKLYDFDIDIEATKRLRPAATSHSVLEHALYSIGYTIITTGQTKHRKLILRVRQRADDEIVTVGAEGLDITQRDIIKAKSELSSATIKLANSFFSSASGIFVADELFMALSSRLHVAKDRRMSEIGGKFSSARQLNFLPTLS